MGNPSQPVKRVFSAGSRDAWWGAKMCGKGEMRGRGPRCVEGGLTRVVGGQDAWYGGEMCGGEAEMHDGALRGIGGEPGRTDGAMEDGTCGGGLGWVMGGCIGMQWWGLKHRGWV